MQVVAAEDDTEVTISPSAAIVGGPGVMGTPMGTPVTYTLNAGQMLQLQQPERLIGSIVQSADELRSVHRPTRAASAIPST